MNPTPRAKGQTVKPVRIDIYHNTDSRFLAYEPGHALTQVISHRRHLPVDSNPEGIADWAFRVFNADLEDLQHRRDEVDGGELDFLIACIYRLMGLRSLSVGDVIGITAGESTEFLACDPFGWRPISAPEHSAGQGLTAVNVYERLRGADHA
jgi:hypothetical protein